jgi:hypothetical protein
MQQFEGNWKTLRKDKSSVPVTPVAGEDKSYQIAQAGRPMGAHK